MSDHPIDARAREEIARSLLGPIDERGYCVCPGVELHTNRSGPVRPDRPGRDCRVYLGASANNPRAVPSVKCVHSSCEGVIAEVNHKLRSEIAKHEAQKAKDAGYRFEPPKQRRRTREEIEREQEERRLAVLADRARRAMPEIFRHFTWTQPDMWESSAALPSTPEQEAAAIISLFSPDDTVWCGKFKDSIAVEDLDRTHPERRQRVARCFRTAREWLDRLRRGHLPGPRICPNALKPGVLSRSDASVLHRRFLVLEHDALPIDEQGAVLRWLREEGGLSLRAVVFTGGKSLHGWFDCPTPARLRELESVLGGMGYDPASFRPHQPYRLPGWPHDKTNQLAAVWWLAPAAQSLRKGGEGRE